MEQLSPLWSVVALAVVMMIGFLVERRTKSSQVHPLEAALASFRIAGLAFCAAAVLLWFSLPSTPVLASFGYPHTLDQIREPRLLLALLQEYNRALVRTTEVLSWFIFIFVFYLLGSTIFIARTATRACVQELQNVENRALANMPLQPTSGPGASG
jgi:hypothetical protein